MWRAAVVGERDTALVRSCGAEFPLKGGVSADAGGCGTVKSWVCVQRASWMDFGLLSYREGRGLMGGFGFVCDDERSVVQGLAGLSEDSVC